MRATDIFGLILQSDVVVHFLFVYFWGIVSAAELKLEIWVTLDRSGPKFRFILHFRTSKRKRNEGKLEWEKLEEKTE